MRTTAPPSLPIFRSALQAEVLTVLLGNPSRWWETRELRETTSSSAASLHAELQRLHEAGLLERKTVGRSHLHRPAADSPLIGPLQQLIERSTAIESRLQILLAQEQGIEAAVLYGSWAAGRMQPDSDVDLLVVGEIDYESLARRVRELEAKIHREIDLTVLTRQELESRADSGFLRTIRSHPTRTLIGDLDSLMNPR